MLRASFIETENEFYYARHMDSNSIEDIQTFLDVSITSNCEGLMVKSFDSPEATYEPSRRSRNWLKVKKDYIKGVGDSMDLVVIGAFHGHGKRTSVYGAFLLACYDPETEEYQTICKIGTGFSDENLKTFYDDLKPHVIDQPLRYYHLGENPVKPDVWFKPVKVWEIECADLSVSPRYMAAVGMVIVLLKCENDGS
jgi:DNA ligase-1